METAGLLLGAFPARAGGARRFPSWPRATASAGCGRIQTQSKTLLFSAETHIALQRARNSDLDMKTGSRPKLRILVPAHRVQAPSRSHARRTSVRRILRGHDAFQHYSPRPPAPRHKSNPNLQLQTASCGRSVLTGIGVKTHTHTHISL